MIENDYDTWTVPATEDLSVPAKRRKVVTLNGAIAADHKAAGGLLMSSAVSGTNATLGIEGIMKAYANAAINTVGFPLTVTTSGYIAAAVSGGPVIGRALVTAASGDLFVGMFDFSQWGVWNGA